MRTKCLCKSTPYSCSRCRVLTSDQLTVDHNLLGPRLLSFHIYGTAFFHLIFEELGHGGGKANDVLLLVAEAGDLATLKKWLPLNLDVDKDNGTVTDGSHDFPRLVELRNELLRVFDIDQIKHWAVAARVEDRIELCSATLEVLQRLCLRPQLLLSLIELDRVGVFEILDGLLVDRSLAAIGRGDCNLRPGRVQLLAVGALAGERVEGMGELGLRG